MNRVAATSAYVRSWLPSAWKRALQRLLHFLLQLSMFPRRLLMLEGSGGGRRAAAESAEPRRRWLRVAADGEPTIDRVDDVSAVRDTASEDDVLFFAADVAHASPGTRRGLANTGNTCFVNAVVQCLLAIPGFVDRLDDEVARVIAQEQEDTAGERTRPDERQKGRDEMHLRLTQTLLDLLKGLEPEEGVDEDGIIDGIIASADSTGRALMNGTAAAHENGTGEARLPVAQVSSVAMGKKRKRPMMTEPGDYSATASTKRLKCFLQAASKCSDLVVAETRHQDQQDAEELLLFLLDSLHELLRWEPHPPTPQQIKNGTTESGAVNGVSGAQSADLVELSRLASLENECLENLKKCVVTDPDTYNTTVAFLGDVRWHRYMKGNASFITEMLTGQIVRGSQCCSCANLTCLHQEFRVLSLSIDASKDVQTLGHCLDRYRGLEDLVEDNKVFCDGHCQDKTSRRTQVLLQRAPPALVIQLQRSKQTSWHASAEKIVASVEFPISDPLNLTENMFLRDHSRPVHYELQAVCAHIGSALDTGHYIAYSRDKTGCSSSSLENNQAQTGDRWYKFDDDFVTTLDAATLRRETLKTAYMLFYTSVDPVVVEQAQQEQHQHKQNPIDQIELENISDRVENDDNI